ncbi:hypothetical protein OS493_013131 [Desmophyllum pertusum]|uniref:Uncharacterized protein n=1 Tax=Desmophyllum pertusum TaxID=174260 RepID=A0A9W9YSW9_9CNID|nr:hypothetical protein OS493_013131 [Desmophyllum pertusum]
MRMKRFREHLRDMLLCKKLQRELNQEMVSLNFAKSWRESCVISGTTANMENIETTIAVSESKDVTGDNSLLQENMKTEDTSSALYDQLLYIRTLKTSESRETRENKETLTTAVNTGAVKRMEAAGTLLSSSFTDSTTTGMAATSPDKCKFRKSNQWPLRTNTVQRT